jgi:hypothetical protein
MSDYVNTQPPTSRDSTPVNPAELLRNGIEKNLLSPEQKAQILADLPSFEEQKRMFLELQAKGGLSFDEFCASLGLEIQPDP